MPTLSILPTAGPDSVIGEHVGAGQVYRVGAAVRDALLKLRLRLQGEQLELDLLRDQVDAGLDALERGVGARVAPSDIHAIIASLADSAAP